MTGRPVFLGLFFALLVGCEPPPAPEITGRDTIVLLGGNVLSRSTRVAELLADIARATDVLGPARFEVISEHGAAPADLPALLGGSRGDVRAVIALVGDLSLLDGVDPDDPIPEPGRLIRRDIDFEAIAGDLRRLANAVEDQGARLVLATAPLGRQGRIEVPELVAFAAWLRERGPVLDLARHFETLEASPLFGNGIDELDDLGHDELARAVYLALLEHDDLLPARDAAERRARRQMDLLGRWAAGEQGVQQELERLVAEAPDPPGSPREATRMLALVTLVRGLTDDVTARWATIPADGQAEIPGLAIGRALSGHSSPSSIPGDSLERELVQLMGVLEQLPADGDDRARAFVRRHPQRLEAWLTLEASMIYTGHLRDVRSEALTELDRYERGPVSRSRRKSLLDDQPASLRALPALVIASRPYVALLPTGPTLDAARKASRRGHSQHAVRLLDRVREQGLLHPTWAAERERIAQSDR